ncbi:MAG TPA: hypothetical protein VH595_07540 [Verrucomicrobiae bacterium]|jgi:hypothetical protein|nr:hypothetical protein [Verrucomicrobiae bacterium]
MWNGPWYAPDEDHEYIGVIEAQFKGRLGIDLTKLRFHDQGDSLVISGLEPQFQSGHRKINCLLAEGRIKKHSDTPLLTDSYTVEKNHQSLTTWKDDHYQRVDQRINDGVEFKWLRDDLRRRARDFLRILLQSFGKKLVFDDSYSGPGCGLNEYIESHNHRIDDNIAKLR